MRTTFVIALLAKYLVVSVLANSTAVSLFSQNGLHVSDVGEVITPSGWFEITTTGILVRSPGLLITTISNTNNTHASVKLWGPPNNLPGAQTDVPVIKRRWSEQGPFAWPAVLYDAFDVLYRTRLQQDTTLSPSSLVALKASWLFYALYGQSTLEQCADGKDIVDQLLLVQHNTQNGSVVQAVTRNNPSNNSLEYVYQDMNTVRISEVTGSDWWADCVFVFH